MPETMFTTDRQPIDAVRVVNPALIWTSGGNPVQAIRIIEGPTWVPGYSRTPSGFPIRSVRLVDGAGAYTTSRSPVATTPEDVYTADGNPIQAVRIFSSVPSPEVVFTADGHFIEAVRLVDNTGGLLAGSADPDVAQWAAAVATNGGTVSPARQAIVQTFVTAEKAAGSWALTEDYWAPWAENAPQALTSLKQRRLVTAVAAPVFTVDRGYTFDGIAQYINTTFNPFSQALLMTGTNLRMAVYERTAVAVGATTSIGSNQNGSANAQMIGHNTGGVVFHRMNASTGTNFTLTVATSAGYTAISRNGTLVSDFFTYKNGVSLARGGSAPTINSVLPVGSLYVGALNNNGVATGFRASSVGFACFGASLSAAQELDQYNNVQAWATAVGANV